MVALLREDVCKFVSSSPWLFDLKGISYESFVREFNSALYSDCSNRQNTNYCALSALDTGKVNH
jgi:hypothetical protein